MTVSKLEALGKEALDGIAFNLKHIRDSIGTEYGLESATYVRTEALSNILSLATPRLRELVIEKGETLADGTIRLVAGGYRLVLGTGKSGIGEPVPQLSVVTDAPGGYEIPLFSGRFLTMKGAAEEWCAARGRSDRELAIIDALQALAPDVAARPGDLTANMMLLHSPEHAIVVADGGFPGPATFEYLGKLRDAVTSGFLAQIAEDPPGLAALQAEKGYVFGSRYLAYDDTDKRSCSVPIPDVATSYHMNIDLIDDDIAWFVAVEPAREGVTSRVAIWPFSRNGSDVVAAANAALSEGMGALGEPAVSLDLATRVQTVPEGFDPGALVTSVCHGLERDLEVYRDLETAFAKNIGIEDRTDFDDLRSCRFGEFEYGTSPSP